MTRLRVSVATALLVLIAAFFIVPLYWLIAAATKSNTALFNSATFVPAALSSASRNFTNLLATQGHLYPRWFLNSLVYATVTAVVGTYIATMTGYSLAKYRYRGRALLLGVVIGGLMVPSTVLIIPIFILERTLHLTNTYEGVILPMLLFPFGVFFMSIYAKDAVSDGLLEAARLDGASEFRILHRIALPVLLPGMVTLFLISFIGAWNNYFLPLVMVGNTKLYPLTVGLGIWLGTVSTPEANPVQYSQILMGALVSVVPMILAFPFLQKYVVRGLSVGAFAAQ